MRTLCFALCCRHAKANLFEDDDGAAAADVAVVAKKIGKKGSKKTQGFSDDNKKWLRVKQGEADDVAEEDDEMDDDFGVESAYILPSPSGLNLFGGVG